MKIYTKVVWSMTTGEVLDRQWFEHSGTVDLLCGATQGQESMLSSQMGFYSTLQQNYGAMFGTESQIFKTLTNEFTPIFQAGPNQYGFSSAEDVALRSQATVGTAAEFAKAQNTLSTRQAAEGGGNVPVVAGSNAAENAKLLSAGAAQESAQQLGITEKGYEVGRENWAAAAEGLAGSGSVFNPSIGMANAANTGGADTANTANQIAQASNSWMGAIGGLAGVASAAITKYCFVAASFFGWNSPKTDKVRWWIISEAPLWFRKFYVRHGEWISRTPLRWVFRPLFEYVLRHE